MKYLKLFFGTMSSIPSLFKLVWSIDKKYLFLTISELICFALLPYPALWLSAYAMDAMDKRTEFTHFAVICVGLLFLTFIVWTGKGYINNNARPTRKEILFGKVRSQFHEKCMDLDYQILGESETQISHQEAARFIERNFSNMIWTCISILSSLIAFILACTALSTVNPWLIAAIVGSTVLSTLIGIVFTPIQNKLNEARNANDRRIEYFDAKSLDYTAAKDIRVFQMEDEIKRRISNHIGLNFKLKVKQSFIGMIQGLLNLLTNSGTDILTYALLGYSVLHNNATIGQFSLAFGSVALFRQYLSEITDTLTYYGGTERSLRYYISFMNQKSKFREGVQKPVRDVISDNYSIEFKNVSFRYPGQENYALRDFSVKINSGEKISIVGENGAGKSTFVKLLCRLYDPDEGNIFLNGTDIRDINYDEYLGIFAAVFQDFKLFAFTLRENVAALETSSDGIKLKSAAEKSGLDKVIEKLSGGFDTFFTKQFDETGVELSGGEQQKAAIARAHYKDAAKIMILDEPTSALDPRAEYETYQRLNELIGNRTAFFISHRLSSSKFCDKIIVIRDGKLSEYETHKQLMTLGGEYAELYNMQAEWYK
ncbi:ABC transporter ATP-binding protein [Clostridia bacterium]|nr:ABC transporter ATP-binding protein [Clostridia bacterium]